MHTIRQLLRPAHLVVTPPEAPVLSVILLMADARVGAIPVVDGDDHIVGIFSERDLMLRVVIPGRDPSLVTVGEVMTPDVVVATPDTLRSSAIETMRRHGCRHLPVVRPDGTVVAVLSMRDLLRDEIEEQHEEIRELRAYIHQSPIA